MLAMHAPSRALRGVRDPREEPARRQRSVGLAIRAEARQRPEGDARRGVQHRPQVSTRVLSPQRTAGLADPFARPGERPRPRLASFDEEEGRRDEVVKLPVRRVGDTNLETPLEDVELMLQALASKKKQWAATSFAERRELALKMVPLLRDECETVAMAATEYKGAYESKLGEEMLHWVIGTSFMLDAAETLKRLDAREEPARRLTTLGPEAVRGIIDVYPLNWFDSFLLPGTRAQVYLKPGEKRVVSGRTALQRFRGPGELCTILGAGNVSSINVSDVVNKVLLDGCVAALKLNPVNEYVGASLERALQPLIARGVLVLFYGGGEVGKALVESPLVDSVHMTGSEKTFDAVVWQGRPKEGPPPLDKPVTAELGCVSPVVVVPGDWTEEELESKAAEICRNVAANASCNCLANKLIVTSASWPQRRRFLEKLREGFRRQEARFVYYPGSAEKLAAFQRAYPTAEVFFKGASLAEGCSPYVLIAGLDPDRGDELAFREEPWATVLSEVPLRSESVPDFLEAAARFCNGKLWGTLSAQLIIHPAQEREHREAFQSFLREMRYGTVAVNTIAGLAFMMPAATWGAYPGHGPEDIQSGVGVVRNSLLIENAEKTVTRGPWDSSMRHATTDFEVLVKGLNQFYGDIDESGQPKWHNLVRFIFGVVTGWYL